jgi:hypothetical protein
MTRPPTEAVRGGLMRQMYTVIFEQDGKTIATFATHAADEADARSQCDAFFEIFYREHPEDTPPRDDSVSIRVELTTRPAQKGPP